jgi:hypothetical protein
MRKALGSIAAGVMLLTAFAGGSAWADTNVVTAKGQWLAAKLDQMGVETKWIAGEHVDWDTGLPDGRPELSSGRHTHCSAFVAATAKRFGVYILRPPEHGQVLLANAQNEWLAEEGASKGWRPVAGPEQAQDLANSGMLVVASYHNHRDDKPGHIAIVRPNARSADQIAAEGPEVIQAGTINSASISIRAGFAGHAHAWNDNEIDYYAHDLPNASAKR